MQMKADNKAKFEKTNATVKYDYNTPYVFDKPSLNPNLKINDAGEEILKSGKKADI